MIPLPAASIALSGVSLLYAAYSDIRTREVTNKLWIIYGPLGGALTIINVIANGLPLTLLAVSIGSCILIAFAAFYLGFIGGADAKALICLAVANPLIPSVPGFLHPFFPLTVFYNGLFFSVITFVYVFFRNVTWLLKREGKIFEDFEKESGLKKVFAFISGYRISLEELEKKKFLFPIEKLETQDNNVRRSLTLFVGAESDRDKIVNEYKNYASLGGRVRTVFATPGIPMLVFISISFFFTLFFGDFILIRLVPRPS